MGKIEIILLIVLAIIILFVGAKKLPELARGVGQSARELKKGFTEGGPDEEKPVAKSSSKKK